MSHPVPRSTTERDLQVLHIASGDRWGGAEAQLCTLLSHLRDLPGARPRAVLMNDADTAARLREAGIPVDILDESRLGAVAILRGLRSLLRQHRPDILHTHRLKENVLGSLASLGLGVPGVRTSHGAPEHRPGWGKPHKQLIHALDRYCGAHLQQRVIAVSRDLGQQLATVFPSGHIAVIENGVDIAALQHRGAGASFREAAPEAVHIGLVGRLDPVKRVDLFLGMAARLLEQPPVQQRGLHFHVFGDGQLRASLEAASARLGLTQAVTFHGHRQDIGRCIASLDLLVMCSDHEGLPMTLLESIVLGTPVIAHRVGGMVEVLEGNCGGLLVSGHSADDYAGAVRDLLQHPDQAGIIARGQARVAERFSARGNAERTLALYRSILEGTS